MKICTKCKIEQHSDQFYIDNQKKDGLSSSCKKCRIPYAKSDGLKASKRWKERNKEKVKLYKQSLLKGPRAPADPAAKTRAKRKWKQVHPEKVLANKAQRRALEFKAYVPWANRFFIEEAYRLARLRTEMFGFKWHVDHVIPLRSPTVCGLHVETNLQVIPAIDNMRKGNRIHVN